MRKTRFKSAEDLADQPLLSAEDLVVTERVGKRYAVGLTDHVLATIKAPLKDDPVAKQYVPQLAELKILPEERIDPIGDDAHTPVKGIVHRYADRALYKLVNVCAVYCRFCFRREKVGPGSESLNAEDRAQAINYIRNTPSIWEVILTGGDPLVLSAEKLQQMLDELCAIPHVEVIRIHTRVPVADPARVTEELCAALKREKAVYVVLHINHGQEITPEVESTIKMLRAADCILLSQSVLLKGVNDNSKTLEALFRKLITLRVKPYYLHHGDLAPGTSHFRTSIAKGRSIMRALGRISGIALPTYMLDIPGGHGKVPIGPTYIKEQEDGSYTIEDFSGRTHTYKDSEGAS